MSPTLTDDFGVITWLWLETTKARVHPPMGRDLEAGPEKGSSCGIWVHLNGAEGRATPVSVDNSAKEKKVEVALWVGRSGSAGLATL